MPAASYVIKGLNAYFSPLPISPLGVMHYVRDVIQAREGNGASCGSQSKTEECNAQTCIVAMPEFQVTDGHLAIVLDDAAKFELQRPSGTIDVLAKLTQSDVALQVVLI